jgi:tetratricopeptide (TPR) repeat protein
MKTRCDCGVLSATLAVVATLVAHLDARGAGVDVRPIQALIGDGKPLDALRQIERELAKRPGDPRLLYDRGVAAYAAGQFDDALLAFDRAQDRTRSRDLLDRTQRQKGNAEFRLGLAARGQNLGETIQRWRTALDQYRQVLQRSPEDHMARTNYVIVRRLLLELLVGNARQQRDQAHQPGRSFEAQVQDLRGALDRFQTARQVDDQDAGARDGERGTRRELADRLAAAGAANARLQPDSPAPAQVPRLTAGVSQLEDAHALEPEDQPITQSLDSARETLATVLAQQAAGELRQAKAQTEEPKRVAQLKQAVELAERALTQRPEHELARNTRNDARETLAALHENKGDALARQAENTTLARTARKLEDALDEYRQAEEFTPEDAALKAKDKRIETRLEETLKRLAADLVQEPPRPPDRPTEPLEQKVARLEDAQHALQDLQQLKPTPQTEEQLVRIEKQLARARESYAALQPATLPPSGDVKFPELLDLPPMPKAKPPPATEFKSADMGRPLKDY